MLLRRNLRWLSRTTRRTLCSESTKKTKITEKTKIINVRTPENLESAVKINQWYFEPHDFVKKNEGLCEIETEDFVADVSSPQDGFLSKIHVTSGTKGVKADVLLCELVLNREDLQNKESEDEVQQDKSKTSSRNVFEDVERIRDLSLEMFLYRLKLDVYLPRMKEEGFDDLVDLVAFSEDEMDFFVRDVGMKPGHEIRLRHGIQQARDLQNRNEDNNDV